MECMQYKFKGKEGEVILNGVVVSTSSQLVYICSVFKENSLMYENLMHKIR